MPLKTILMLAAGIMFWAGLAGFLHTVIKLRPPKESDLDDCYYEFEDQHPALARYNKWRNIWLSCVFIAMLLLFAAIAL